MVRSVLGLAVLAVCSGAVAPAVAQTLKPEEARKFVAGKLFAFTCFEGTRGAGRIQHDGSVAGSIQFQGSGPVRHVSLPANTLQVRGEYVCAQVKGMPFEPCFNLEKTDNRSFRGSVSGFGFAYCEFTRRNVNTVIAGASETAAPRRRAARREASAVVRTSAETASRDSND